MAVLLSISLLQLIIDDLIKYMELIDIESMLLKHNNILISYQICYELSELPELYKSNSFVTINTNACHTSRQMIKSY